jgi:NAD(P)-dependent dehydrogenase (short-subunit alcohol dehydrogenase family)
VDAASRHVHDVADFTGGLQLADEVRQEHGRVDGLVHLVGGWRSGSDPDDWDWLESRLLTSLRYATLAFHDDLSAAEAGRLVIIGSTTVSAPTWSNANYATLKAAAETWVSAVAPARPPR